MVQFIRSSTFADIDREAEREGHAVTRLFRRTGACIHTEHQSFVLRRAPRIRQEPINRKAVERVLGELLKGVPVARAMEIRRRLMVA